MDLKSIENGFRKLYRTYLIKTYVITGSFGKSLTENSYFSKVVAKTGMID